MRGHVFRKPAQAGFVTQLVSGPRVRQTRKRARISVKSR